MSCTNKDILNQLSQVLTVIPRQYVDTLLVLHEKLDDKKINWVVGGVLAECLETVQGEPDCIEIVCTKEEAEKIFNILSELNPNPIIYSTQQLPRNAFIAEKEYPVYIKSYFWILTWTQ